MATTDLEYFLKVTNQTIEEYKLFLKEFYEAKEN